jgi:phosphate transport system permease protein
VRTSVLPYARPGVIGASMLGLRRALGETIAVALVLPTKYDIVWRILEPGGNTIAAPSSPPAWRCSSSRWP